MTKPSQPSKPSPPSQAAGGGSSDIYSALNTLRSSFHASQQPTFISDLSVAELILLEEVGYAPVEIVSGAGSASWYVQFTTAGTEGDIWAGAIAAAIGEARDQVRHEVEQRQADGVVAMRLEFEREPANLLTCSMLGTAVRRIQRDAHQHQQQHGYLRGGPFTTTLSARDFHLLVRAGYSAAGIVFGTAVVGFGGRSASQSLGLSRDNVELESQTNALYSAREKAMDKMEREAIALGAQGVVAVDLSERPVNSMLTHAVELIVIGTAVYRGSDGHKSLGPQLQLALDDPDGATLRGAER